VLPEGLRREGPRREVLRLQAERRGPLMERHSVQAELPCPEHPEAARLDVPAGPHRERPGCPSAAVAPMASVARLLAAGPQVVRLLAERRSEPAEPGVPAAPRREAQRVSAAQPQAALAAWGAEVPAARGAERDAAAEPRQVAGPGAAALPPEEAVERDAAAAQPQAVERDVAVAARPQAAVRTAAEVAPRQAAARVVVAAEPRPGALAVPVSEGLQREAPDEAQVARPSAAAWAAPLCLPCLRAGRPAPSARAQPAHARGRLRTAQP
jgi:hypothetical protein